jgi:ABC-2 type transport system permease protein
MLAVLKKELRTYFLTPTGWIFMAVFLLISGLLFTIQNVFGQSPDVAGLLAGLLFVFLLVIPLLTMRIFTDERRFRTDQLLLTGPTNLWSIVTGKFLAAFIVYLLTVAVTVAYPAMISGHGRLEWSKIIGTYIGFILLGGAFISVGVWVSSISEGVVGAAVITFLALMVTFIIDFLRPSMPTTEVAGLVWGGILALAVAFWVYWSSKNGPAGILVALVFAVALVILWFTAREAVFVGLVGKSLGWISLTRRFRSFSLGLWRLDATVYYISFAAFFLFLTVQGLEKRRWS